MNAHNTIKAHRLALGWSARELARRAGVGKMTVLRAEAGSACTLATLSSIAAAFGVHPASLLLSEATATHGEPARSASTPVAPKRKFSPGVKPARVSGTRQRATR